jgi:hypothetical protein
MSSAPHIASFSTTRMNLAELCTTHSILLNHKDEPCRALHHT